MTAPSGLTEAPVTIARWPDERRYRPLLMRVVDDARAKVPSGTLGPAKGAHWCGPKTLFEDERAAPLEVWLRSLLPGPVEAIDAWGFVMHHGCLVAEHDHVRSHRGGSNAYAGVYYLTSAVRGGRLVVGGEEHVPQPGLAVTFEARMPHSVTRLEDTMPRMSIAFSARAA